MKKMFFGFLGSHILNTVVTIFFAIFALFILKMGFMATVWFTVIAGLLWICRSGIANIVAGIIEHKTGKELNKVSLRNLHLAISAALLVILVVIPLIFALVFGGIGYIFEFCGNVSSVLAEDLTVVNGIGFTIFAIAELLVTIIASVTIIYLFNNMSGKNMVIGIAIATVVQRTVSFLYYYAGDGSYVSGMLDFIAGTLLFAGITAVLWLVSNMFKKLTP